MPQYYRGGGGMCKASMKALPKRKGNALDIEPISEDLRPQ